MRSYVGFSRRATLGHEAGGLLLLKLVNALACDFRERGGSSTVGDDGVFHEFEWVIWLLKRLFLSQFLFSVGYIA